MSGHGEAAVREARWQLFLAIAGAVDSGRAPDDDVGNAVTVALDGYVLALAGCHRTAVEFYDSHAANRDEIRYLNLYRALPPDARKLARDMADFLSRRLTLTPAPPVKVGANEQA